MIIVFFMQTTAYEMRISDWSSDVCSSDLLAPRNRRGHDPHQRRRSRFLTGSARADDQRRRAVIDPRRIAGGHDSALEQRRQLGQTFNRALGARMLAARSEEHTSELQSLMRNSYADFSLTKQKTVPRSLAYDEMRCKRRS